jgi:hypothetical protein
MAALWLLVHHREQGIMSKTLKFIVLAVVILLVVSQFIQSDRSNPPTNPESTFGVVAKPSPEVAAIVKRACYDCHSNNTVWPWYSRIAPVSWLVADDVKEGRAHMNFSEWGLLGADVAQKRLMSACDEVKAGGMPLWQYRLMHPEAKLSEQDIKIICGAASR